MKAKQRWKPHRDSAHAILFGIDAGLAEFAAENAHETTLKSANDQPPLAAAGMFGVGGKSTRAKRPAIGAGGALGSLKLTFSTIALFTRDKNWFFQKNEFYVRQDNAEVTYGSEFYHEFTAERRLFAPSEVSITLPAPRALAVNRFTLALKAYPEKFDPTSKHHAKNDGAHDEILLDPIEKALTAELERQMARVEPQAIMISKGLIVDQMRALMRQRGADVIVRFERNEAPSENELLSLLYRMNQSVGEQPSADR